ncbi:MAG: phosphoglucosamine mutase [Acidobacteriota bacterium]
MKRLFGTDGIRGVAGEFPLDPATVERVGAALSTTLAAAGGGSPRIVIGRDTRESGPAIEEALVRGIARVGGRAVRGGVLTTPAVACVARLLGFDAGVVVSASHNPYRDNGIKVFSRDGAKLPDAQELKIERRVLDGGAPPPGAAGRREASARSRARKAGDARATEDAPLSPEDLRERYLEWLAAALPPRSGFPGWSIVLDCANGAASDLGPALFQRLGAEVTALNVTPDGRNINAGCGALHPDRLCSEVVRRRARIGFAFDGDADRCVAADASGRLLDGDHLMYLAARDMKGAARLRGSTVVATVMSNLWLERALRAEAIRMLRAPVGDRYVLEEMRRGGFVLGGEPSGHVIFLEKATTGDGLLTALLVLDLLRRTGIDLAAWAGSVRPCPQVLVNVPVREQPPLASHPAIGPAILEEERRLGARGRLLVRYSGTEPKARIMVEGESRDAVQACAARLRDLIEREIGRARARTEE